MLTFERRAWHDDDDNDDGDDDDDYEDDDYMKTADTHWVVTMCQAWFQVFISIDLNPDYTCET